MYQEFRGVKERRVHGARSMFSVPEYRLYRDATQDALGRDGVFAILDGHLWAAQSPREIEGELVSCNYFDVLRLRPLIGTGFTAANCDAPTAAPSVILSHALWTREFAADPNIVAEAITLNGQTVGVVGVAPEGFDGIDITKAAFFAPISLQTVLLPTHNLYEDAHASWLTLIGRRVTGGNTWRRSGPSLRSLPGKSISSSLDARLR